MILKNWSIYLYTKVVGKPPTSAGVMWVSLPRGCSGMIFHDANTYLIFINKREHRKDSAFRVISHEMGHCFLTYHPDKFWKLYKGANCDKYRNTVVERFRSIPDFCREYPTLSERKEEIWVDCFATLLEKARLVWTKEGKLP
jgi:hypothetical protein